MPLPICTDPFKQKDPEQNIQGQFYFFLIQLLGVPFFVICQEFFETDIGQRMFQ